MGTSYKEENEQYKNAKRAPYIEDSRQHYPKKKVKKKNKRSNHKHEYVKALFHGKGYVEWSLGEYCKHCGRIKDRKMIWKEENLDYYLERYKIIEIENDDFFLKYISI